MGVRLTDEVQIETKPINPVFVNIRIFKNSTGILEQQPFT